ncbi:ATP-binding cassette sub-family C member 10 [Paramormyrops kingsleyae]|uniref:ATP-binding cassette sub-family C member 10 n=1 Tax=Paramormyrops kingsleyae TaxID=1676925 RepID=UPI003B96D0EB
MPDFIEVLCHTNHSDPFPIWKNGTISPCFNQLILNCISHSVLAFSSACYLSTPRCRRLCSPTFCGWGCRTFVSFLMAALFLCDVVIVSLLSPVTMYLDILADGSAIIAWFVHFGALVVLQKSVYAVTRGPLTLLVLAIMPLFTLSISMIAYCMDPMYVDLSHPLRFTRLVLLAVQLFLLFLYVFAFAIPPKREHTDQLSVNDSDQAPLIPGEVQLDQCGQIIGEDGCSWVSRIFYFWLNPLMKRGQLKELERPSDVYQLPCYLQTRVICQNFNRYWKQSQQQMSVDEGQMKRERKPVTRNLPDIHDDHCEDRTDLCDDSEVTLLQVLHKAFGTKYYLLGLLKLVGNILSFAGPLLLSSLVGFMETSQAPISQGLWCSLGLLSSTLLSAVLRNIFSFEVSKVSLSARAAVISTIYRKALRVSSSTLAHFTLGEIVNFMSTDTDRLTNFLNNFHDIWNLPLQFAITLYLFYLQVGLAFLAGLGFAVLLVPVNKALATCIMKNNKYMLKYKDSRVKLMTELLLGMRVIKFYTWEFHFSRKIADYRKQELSHLKAIKYLDAVCVYTWAALPVVISILTFVTYVLLGNELTAAKVFTTLALVGMLILPLNNFPWILNSTVEAKVSLDRIQRFLRLCDQDLDVYYCSDAPEDPQTAVQMKNCTFSWHDSEFRDLPNYIGTRGSSPNSSQLLQNINITIKKGSLVAVVGKVGCGKSTLLAAVVGELTRCGGAVYVEGRENGFAIAAQEPWIQHGSVRDNILFGKEYRSRLYQAVLEACALSEDLSILPSGDLTEVGENGVTLSGGQKARLALARAIYMEKDIYLLDDPLAAVDADVAKHLLEKCVLGILKHKTRIICTHRIEFLHRVDAVVLMDNGTVVKIGSPEEILPLVEAVPKDWNKSVNKKQEDELEWEQQQVLEEFPEQSPLIHSMVDEEQKQSGVVTWKVYHSYWLAVGGCLAFLIILFLFLMQASKNVSDWWLAHWISSLKNSSAASHKFMFLNSLSPSLATSPGMMYTAIITDPSAHANVTGELRFYLTVYVSIAAGNSVFTVIRAFLFAYGTICAATVIHTRLLDRVLKSTVTFFDSTPLGRIINRFSSDLYSVDDTLPFILNILLANIFGLLGMLVMISYGLPWILLLLLPLAALYYKIQSFYRHTSRELKRLYSITLSPIYSHFSETLTGLCTIRASCSTHRFQEENANRLEMNQRCLFASNAAMQWLDIRLQMIGVLVVTGLSVIAIIQHQMKSVDSGLVGLSLSYALSITGLLSGLISSFTQVETQMVSVERTEEYSTSIPMEPQQGGLEVPPLWPEHGQVEFRQVELVYRPGLPNALDKLTIVIRPGEKVGVVGRTGSGKSTMFLALFRMMELSGGQILVDGVDISHVGLRQLRSKLAIIPQDPFLFSGTVRENLDPCGRHSEAELIDVLEQCHLLQAVDRMGGLDTEVGEKGKSLSLGQRQLLCLARALLTQAKVLCIDEATASVDQKTDKLLQQTIRLKFKDRTVLTIAHRINTILDSDRVLVIHAGKAVEFDTPDALCHREDSFLNRLIHVQPE